MITMDDRWAPGEAEHCSLALVNTRLVLSGASVDLLADPVTAARWLSEQALGAADAERLTELREAMRRLFEARASGTAPDASDLGLINATAAAAPMVPVLNWDDAGPVLSHERGGRDERTTSMARLAADAMALVAGPAADSLTPCRAHGCVRWFVRTHAARQWCSTRCGDRVRAARHYARARR
jgi:predicted RNA-binding Zn ribbon-like protein